MNSSLRNSSPTDLSGSYINQLGQFENILDKANKKEKINNTPDNTTETYDIDSQRIRLQTIASRLWLLGYLPRKIAHKKCDYQEED